MSLRTVLARLGIAAAGGALVVGGAGPALASGSTDDGGHHHGHHHEFYKGVVTAPGGLNLRDRPTRGSAVIGFAHHGQVVSIFCKTPGEKVKGNPLWYLLADGTWAWGTARFIDNIGPAPRWC
ncbi:SH3 domain-containing protein [Streptomyces albicerus]|uniref:SH3 domain-containing protein n=1 Tax=Streptomyces albicerus TaxID=2569859 RepID=UPI00124B0ADC|nr:SH3 domain-containing protein [Streptomyces albicerus]